MIPTNPQWQWREAVGTVCNFTLHPERRGELSGGSWCSLELPSSHSRVSMGGGAHACVCVCVTSNTSDNCLKPTEMDIQWLTATTVEQANVAWSQVRPPLCRSRMSSARTREEAHKTNCLRVPRMATPAQTPHSRGKKAGHCQGSLRSQ